MAISFGDIYFDGMKGTLQRPKPVFDKYTRLGADQVYVQRLRTESIESNLETWSIFSSYEAAKSHERSLKNNLGIPLTFTQFSETPIYGVFILDYTCSIKAGANNKFLATYTLTVVCDEKSGVGG